MIHLCSQHEHLLALLLELVAYWLLVQTWGLETCLLPGLGTGFALGMLAFTFTLALFG